jgi:two-component system NtrC family sensor kinase
VHAAKMASLGQLVAGIAHELNNPISFIYSNMVHLRDYGKKLIGLVDVAGRKGDLEKAKQDVEFEYIKEDLPRLIDSCEEGAKRTRDIVIGLRNFSRLEEAKIKEVDIHEGIDNTLKLIEGEYRSRIEIKKNYGQLPKVMCYPSQLNQVFMNILTNAMQAIVDQGVITITTTTVGHSRVSVSIKDTGRGMSDEVREKIFDPFFTTKDISSGTGLGMSITYGIVEKHGGNIAVTSSLGKGTEFIVTLPVRAL